MNAEDFEKLKDAFSGKGLLDCGEPGRIAQKLADLEGYALWIPRFVQWLFENYHVKPKVLAPVFPETKKTSENTGENKKTA